jgi:gamma-glutamyltranspeptidase/glutathione hydrolase
MIITPKRIILFVAFLAALAAIVAAVALRSLILTGGLNKSERPEMDGVGGSAPSTMVVGTTGGAAQEIGADILRQGGSAVDAAMATAMAQITLAGGSWVSFAGINTLVYYEAKTGKVYNMNAAFNTVQGESDYKDVPSINVMALVSRDPEKDGHYNGRTVLVPGFMRGVEAAHNRFGKLALADIFEPVIQLAETGFEVNEGLGGIFSYRKKILSKFPETKQHFIKPDGTFYEKGDVFKQPALAKTLREVVANGADYMYTGPWAQKFVAAVRGIGGRITMDDMANYKAEWVEPLQTTHNGYEIYAHGLPGYGGVNLLEAMNLIEAAELTTKLHYSKSPDSFFWLSHITRAANASRNFSGGNAVDNKENVLQSRIKKSHATNLWQRIRKQGGYQQATVDIAPKHSDGVVVVDAEGNMAAMLHTINAISYGETGLVIDGISVPDALTNQLDVARETTPGERLPDPGAPAVVLKDGKPFAAFSTIGAGLHPRLVSVMHNVLDFGMTPAEALDQPALGFTLNFPGFKGRLWGSYQTVTSGEFPPEFEGMVSDLGLDIVYNRSYSGYVVGVQIDSVTGERHGGTIMQFGGRPVGY